MLCLIRLQLFFKWSYYAEVWTVECRIFSVVLEPFSTSEQNRLCINCSSFSPVKHSGKYMNQQLEHKRFFIIRTNCICVVVWDNVVCIATCYWLDGPGIESWRKWDVPHPSSPPSLLYNRYQVFFLGVKRPEHGVNHPPPPSAEVKERVELYLYSLSRPLWPLPGWIYLCICVAYITLTDKWLFFQTALTSCFFHLLGYYAPYVRLEPTFPDYLAVPSSRVKSPRRNLSLEDKTDRWSRNVGCKRSYTA